MFQSHTDNIRHVVFSSIDNQKFVSASDDKTVKFWDKRSQSEVFKLTFEEIPNGIDISKDKSILSICYGSNVMFFNLETMNKICEFRVPTQVYSSSLHPDKNVFVCGGEDFLMYKYDFQTGQQLGMLSNRFAKLIRFCTLESFRGHFGAVHCVRFSPDGELYASGSEDGTLRLWQNTVGKTYGLWKFVGDDDDIKNDNNKV